MLQPSRESVALNLKDRETSRLLNAFFTAALVEEWQENEQACQKKVSALG